MNLNKQLSRFILNEYKSIKNCKFSEKNTKNYKRIQKTKKINNL